MIETNRIRIRTINESEISHFHQLISDIEAQGEFLPVSMLPETTFRRQVEENGLVTESSERYVITNSETEIVGSIWAFKSVPYFDALEIGYQIFENENRRKGYAAEALELFVDYLFKVKQTNRLEIRTAIDNEASEKVALKSGFQLEGVNRGAAFSGGKLHDMRIYALLRHEWSANRVAGGL
ncbi:MAG: GNAT family protein [Candidatus Sedimenticola sp. (ex Thyasira tokunagai)]